MNSLLPLCSICITNYNKAQYVGQAIESALDQDYENTEIIVCDDGSTDNSVEIIEKYLPHGIKLIQQENSGTAEARNTCIKHCSAESIGYFQTDSDDVLENYCVSEKIEVLMKYPDAGIIYSDFRTYDEASGRITNEYRPHFSVLDNLQQYICGTNIFLTKKAVETVGLYDRNYKIIEDYHMSIKVSRYLFCYHIASQHYIYRNYSNQKTQTAIRNNIEQLNSEYFKLNQFKKELFGIQ